MTNEVLDNQNLTEFSLRGNNVFRDLKLNEADRLNRVYKEYGKQGKDLFMAAISILIDPDFYPDEGQLTSSDIVSIVKAIKTEDVISERFYYFSLIIQFKFKYKHFRKVLSILFSVLQINVHQIVLLFKRINFSTKIF